MKGFPVCSDNGPFPLQRVDNQERVKIGFNVLKIFYPRTTEPISTKPGTKHPFGMGFQVYTNEVLVPLQRGNERLEVGLIVLKIFFSRTIGPVLTYWYKASFDEGLSDLFN